MTLWIEAKQSERIGRQVNPDQFSGRVAATFTSRETMHIMEKAKQFEAALVTTFASRQNGSKQTVDAFAQHAAAPGAVQYLLRACQAGISRSIPNNETA